VDAFLDAERHQDDQDAEVTWSGDAAQLLLLPPPLLGLVRARVCVCVCVRGGRVCVRGVRAHTCDVVAVVYLRVPLVLRFQ